MCCGKPHPARCLELLFTCGQMPVIQKGTLPEIRCVVVGSGTMGGWAAGQAVAFIIMGRLTHVGTHQGWEGVWGNAVIG